MDEWQGSADELRAKRPAHILFLCVANSARSQLAEALARRLAPKGLKISSAGSAPGSLRPEVALVLAEVGVDCAGQYAKGLAAVDLATVEAVITLCSEEVCPYLPGALMRLHWGLPDPAAVAGAGRIEAFRQVRDELTRRLSYLFASWPVA
ncbi:MAG: Arsenate-mycothiol transferase ArsC1 [Deltaproteobacteria bacterium ADurb.Bin510]|nr:MAG: Arsenate-mycothiol transferase ArsC1 [Deltaproteobacteria bacterium ADurb.Bin510]